ncbi:KH domain-containing protein [Carex littledalei]|uniref:KH domain-containing protein n=1 Tax=Carex littledalei TaxID=544730 RepID=A0A833QEM2_9POAL|nr:KH domain-containing protein [Carex littledalei]
MSVTRGEGLEEKMGFSLIGEEKKVAASFLGFATSSPGKVGLVIGIGGETIKSMQAKSGARIQESGDSKCQCPSGFKGDGTKTCEVTSLNHNLCNSI